MKAIASIQTITWFYQRFKENALELSPDFQRNPVWQQPQKDYLIETILLQLPVPEIYMVNRIKPTGESTYVIVDGQQRLRTILEFVNLELELRKTPLNHSSVRKFTDLSDEEKQRFWRYPIVVRDLEDSSDDDIRNLFQRLNKYAFVLNEQELRNARFKGVFLKTVENLGEHSFWTTSGLFSANDIRRMLDLEYIGILLTSMIGGIYHRKERLDEFYVMYEPTFDEANHYIERFESILEAIEAILPNIRKLRWANKADFFAMFLCLDQLNPDTSDTELINKIRSGLLNFEALIQKAKNEPDQVDQKFKDYADAATVATNDKDRRLKRFRILKEYLHQNT